MTLRRTIHRKFSPLAALGLALAAPLLLAACHSDPCGQYVRFDIPTQQRLIWVCTRADLKLKADPGLTVYLLRMEPAHRTMSVSGTGRLTFGTHVLNFSNNDVSIDGYPMNNDTTATIDARGTVTMGAMFRDFD